MSTYANTVPVMERHRFDAASLDLYLRRNLAETEDFKRASAVEVWAGRVVPSRHNTSAPDMILRDFQGR